MDEDLDLKEFLRISEVVSKEISGSGGRRIIS